MSDSDLTATRWETRWADVLRGELLGPRLEPEVSRKAQLCGVTFYAQSFVLRQGHDPAAFIGPETEAQLATALRSSALVSAVPFRNSESRHSGAVTIVWAATQRLPLDFEWSIDRDGLAASWVWQHRINEVFDALEWERPDLNQAKLTWSGDLIEWKLDLRLYGPITPTTVIEQQDTLRQLLGADTIEVTSGRRAVTLRIAGQPARKAPR